MRSYLLLLIISLLLIFKSNAQFNFNQNSCIDKLPESSDLKLEIGNDLVVPIEIKLSSLEYDPISNQAFTVTIELNNDLIKINSLMLQAVLDDLKLDKVIGVWDLSESIQTINCNGPKVYSI